MVQEPFLKHLGPALPVDVAAAARQETGHGVPAQVVDPSLLPQLPHQGVDPGEARAAVFPAAEPGFGGAGVDGVGARDEVGVRVRLGGKVPGDEAGGGVVVRLGEAVAQGGLGGEVHVAEEELADEVGGDSRRFGFVGRFFDDGLDAPVEEADREGAEMVVRREERGGLRGEGCGCRFRFREGGGVMFVCNEGVKSSEGVGFAAAMGGGSGFESKFRHCGDGEVALRA